MTKAKFTGNGLSGDGVQLGQRQAAQGFIQEGEGLGVQEVHGDRLGLADDGTYYTDKAGEIVLEGIEPGTTVIAREIKTVEGYVLDGTPQASVPVV